MSEQLESLPLADTSDMPRMHQVFRDAVTSGPTLVTPVAPGDVTRAEYVATYYDNVLRLLHGHHEGEDEVMTPVLVERATPDEAEVVRRVADQHQAVLDVIGEAERSLAAWRAAPDARTAATLVAALEGLGTALTAHLDDEERLVLPIAGRYLNVAEWGRLPEHGLKSFTGDKLWLVIGLIQEQMTPEQVAEMDTHMPPPLTEFWTSTGRRMFSDYMAGLRG